MDASGPADAGAEAGAPDLVDASGAEDAEVQSPIPPDAATVDAGETGGAFVDAIVHGPDAMVHHQDWPFAEATDGGTADAGQELSVDHGTAIDVDGDVGEWVNSSWTPLTHRRAFSETIHYDSELAAVCAWRQWDGHLFLALVVRDDVHDNTYGGYDIWKGDSVQVAFDVGQGRHPYDWEYGFALVDGEVEVHRWLASDARLTSQFPAAIRRWGDTTVYEVGFSPESLQLETFDGARIEVSLALNESDHGERALALELAPGIVQPEKSKADFMRLTW